MNRNDVGQDDCDMKFNIFRFLSFTLFMYFQSTLYTNCPEHKPEQRLFFLKIENYCC